VAICQSACKFAERRDIIWCRRAIQQFQFESRANFGLIDFASLLASWSFKVKVGQFWSYAILSVLPTGVVKRSTQGRTQTVFRQTCVDRIWNSIIRLCSQAQETKEVLIAPMHLHIEYRCTILTVWNSMFAQHFLRRGLVACWILSSLFCFILLWKLSNFIGFSLSSF